MRPHKSITWRITAYLLGFIAALLASFWLCQMLLLPTLYQAHRRNKVEQTVSAIGDTIGAPLFSRMVAQTAREQSACIRILRLSGTEIMSLDYMPYSDLRNVSKARLMLMWQEAALNGGALTQIYAMDSLRLRRLVPLGVNAIIYVQIFEGADREPTAVFYSSTITPVDGIQEVLRTELLWITVVSMVFAILLAYRVANQTARPITRINDQVRRLKSREYPVHFDCDSYLEVAELSDTLNATSRELELLEGLRRELISNVSHDLRTPLSMILAYCEIMRDMPEENTPENIQIIIDETNRLNDLVNDVLLYPEHADFAEVLKCTTFDFAAACRKTIGLYQRLSVSRHYSISYLGPEHLQICADRLKLSQVIYNLLSNAISHAGRHITIQLRVLLPDEDTLRVEVVDDGEGIPPEKLSHIWDRFYSDTEDTSFHAGLGLTIVRRVLELHHALYGAESVLGQGSTFSFSIQRFDPRRY